ncbi:MAG: GGDEF domain-containing protein [Planctomycetota bacterium]
MGLLHWLERRPRWLRMVLQLVAAGLIGIADFFAGIEIAFSIFYMAPVATTSWIDGGAAGAALGVICGAIWLTADLNGGHHYTHAWIPYWNMVVRVGFLWIFAATVARLKTAHLREREMARRDALTGLWNRRHFLELTEAEARRSGPQSGALTLAYLDLDNFKSVNDTLGHAAGDRLLQAVGRMLQTDLRRQDIAARLGGDEFALLLPGTGFTEADRLLTRLTGSLGQIGEAQSGNVSFSVGAITFAAPHPSVETMIHATDRLMYRVKRSGKAALLHEKEPQAGQRETTETRLSGTTG